NRRATRLHKALKPPTNRTPRAASDGGGVAQAKSAGQVSRALGAGGKTSGREKGGALRRAEAQARSWRAKAEVAARELSEVLTALCDFFVVVGPDWKFRQVDPRLQPLVGDVSGRDCWDVFSRVKGTALEREVRSAMEDRKERRFNYHDVVSRRWFQCRVLPGPDGSLRLLASEIAAPAQVETPAEPLREKGFSLRDAGFRDEPGS